MAYREIKLEKGQGKALFDSWNEGFDGKPDKTGRKNTDKTKKPTAKTKPVKNAQNKSTGKNTAKAGAKKATKK